MGATAINRTSITSSKAQETLRYVGGWGVRAIEVEERCGRLTSGHNRDAALWHLQQILSAE